MTFVQWAEQQWILNLLLFPQLLWQDKICINFCCTSCTFNNLSNSMPSSSRVPVSWCSIAIGIAANPLFFQVLRSKDQRLCNEKPTKLEMTFTSFRNTRVNCCLYLRLPQSEWFSWFTCLTFSNFLEGLEMPTLCHNNVNRFDYDYWLLNELLSLEVRW